MDVFLDGAPTTGKPSGGVIRREGDVGLILLRIEHLAKADSAEDLAWWPHGERRTVSRRRGGEYTGLVGRLVAALQSSLR